MQDCRGHECSTTQALFSAHNIINKQLAVMLSRSRQAIRIRPVLWWQGPRLLTCLLLLLSAWAGQAQASVVSVQIDGINGGARDNIAASPILIALQSAESLSRQRLTRARESIIEQAADALKPYGYYNPRIQLEITGDEQGWKLMLKIEPGVPIKVTALNIEIGGAGSDAQVFQEWRKNWPLAVGDRLQQGRYEAAKKDLMLRARQNGYINARLSTAEIQLDPGIHAATINLVMDTGERAVFGEIDYGEPLLTEHTMQRLQPFAPGDPYSVELLEQLRNNLAGSGYFDRVDIVEHLQSKAQPPRVDLQFKLQARPRNTYTVGVGVGTDTGPRLTTGWDIHRLNQRGDTLSLGFGLQQTDKEFFARSEYKRPIGDDHGEFFFASVSAQRKDDDFQFIRTNSDESAFPEIDGNRFNQLVNTGLIKQFYPGADWSLTRHIFLGLLNESFNTDDPDPASEQLRLLQSNPALQPLLNQDQQILHTGFSWQLQKITGQGFAIEGTNMLWRVIGAVDGALSDLSFVQSYVGLNHQRLLHENGKLIMSAELGYTESKVDNLLLEQDGETLDFSLTRLPERFRFQAGGDRSVRGFGYQSLSNNRNGSNHLLTGSIEYEHRISDAWSLAAFTDAGNAFNDFNKPKPQWAAGLGARFYTAVGPIRLDLAHQIDTGDNAIRIHLTIGTPLVTFGSLPYLSGVQ
jgi:translocation and assembly module TamA